MDFINRDRHIELVRPNTLFALGDFLRQAANE